MRARKCKCTEGNSDVAWVVGGAGVKVEAGYAGDVGVVMDLAVESSWTEGAEGVAGMYHGV